MSIIQQDYLNFSMFQHLQQQELNSITKLVSDFPVFHKWFEMTAEFKLMAKELQAYEIASDFDLISNRPYHSSSQVTARHDNIVYVNFQQRVQFAPYIILLNNYYDSPIHLEKLKAHLFPLIELCSVQRRDCRIVLATGETIVFPCGQVGPMQLNAFSSIGGKKQQPTARFTLEQQFATIQACKMPYGEILIASSQPIEVQGTDVYADVALSAMFLNENVFEMSEMPEIEKVYFIEEAE